MRFLEKLKHIKSFSVLIIPDHSGAETTSYKLTTTTLLIYLSIYSLAVALLGFLILNITPLDRWVFGKQSGLTEDQVEMVSDLNEKMLFLTRELEGLKSTNERLKYAIILGDSSLIDSLNKSIDTSSKQNNAKNGGNLFSIFRELFLSQPEDKENKSYYFSKPVNGFVSRKFNPEKGHMGLDFVVKSGTPIYSAASGYVIFSDYTVKNGYMVIISHSENYISVYKHCSSLIKKEREKILQGELIALSGNSGEITTGPHLHFEIWQNGKPVDPEKFLINY